EADPGSNYDVVLLTNFLHHFAVPTCEQLLRRVHGWLKPEGVVVTLEFVPNEDRVSPPGPAAFSLVMLATTEAGDAYTFSELDSMFRNAGFGDSTAHPLMGGASMVIVTRRQPS
ncbi:MAG: class I SAM-dependent methyltransferase, partial [Armatimonadetes bacterium]|nr:class I SAM-dependent methyltransferase [Armatimonadota bacterium]